VFVEKDARTAGFIRQNLAAVCKSLGRTTEGLQVVTADATGPLPEISPDMVFIDPPYEIIGGVALKVFTRLDALLADNPDPIVVFEMPGEQDLSPPGWTCVKRLGKGGRQPTAAIFRTNRALS
jgi:16S rRNA (guanine966-N2)-methyltransferase